MKHVEQTHVDYFDLLVEIGAQCVVGWAVLEASGQVYEVDGGFAELLGGRFDWVALRVALGGGDERGEELRELLGVVAEFAWVAEVQRVGGVLQGFGEVEEGGVVLEEGEGLAAIDGQRWVIRQLAIEN